MSQSEKLLLQALAGHATARPPIWMMRQAGRFLPEYREVRATTSSFLEFCYTPEKAIEVTLQPIRRFGFDASIMFADILVIPDALGQKVTFQENVGPVLEPVTDAGAVARLSADGLQNHLAPVYETLKGLSAALPPHVTLIGFAGAPWTVATYMVGGRGSPTQAAARLLAYREPQTFQALIDLLVEATASYLIAQVEAGAEVLQLFDTWAGSLAPDQFEKWCVAPTKKIVEAVRAIHPDVPIIGFPKGVGTKAVRFLQETGVQGISVDTGTDMIWARETLSPLATVQGNLDPLALVAGGAELDRATDALLENFAGRPYIFNLGHGIEKETPPEHVAQVVRRVQA
ncbi:MAG: uroporphyrinogen decarboxylase [Alphaproteobacteria bacterium]|nr:MAG: uroporphyrinogen decarboxylase [Alphaproteobacteria bacterium]